MYHKIQCYVYCCKMNSKYKLLNECLAFCNGNPHEKIKSMFTCICFWGFVVCLGGLGGFFWGVCVFTVYIMIYCKDYLTHQIT